MTGNKETKKSSSKPKVTREVTKKTTTEYSNGTKVTTIITKTPRSKSVSSLNDAMKNFLTSNVGKIEMIQL